MSSQTRPAARQVLATWFGVTVDRAAPFWEQAVSAFYR